MRSAASVGIAFGRGVLERSFGFAADENKTTLHRARLRRQSSGVF
jgi:hypothetical protein